MDVIDLLGFDHVRLLVLASVDRAPHYITRELFEVSRFDLSLVAELELAPASIIIYV